MYLRNDCRVFCLTLAVFQTRYGMTVLKSFFVWI